MSSPKTAVIVNPHSANRRTGRRWPAAAGQLRAAIGGFDTLFTERPGHASALAKRLAEAGFTRIIAAGGDGTVNEIVNGLLDRNGEALNPDVVLGVLPLGTGGDFRRSLGLASLSAGIQAIATGDIRRIDAGRVAFRTHAGNADQRYFANLVSFGMGGEVALRAKNAFGIFGGKAAFLYATVSVFLSYRARPVRLRLDSDIEERSFRVLNVAVGNGRFHGGGMHVCPRAALHDGLLEVTVIDALGMLTLLKDLPVLYSDNIYRHPKTHHFRAQRVTAESDERTSIEVDGEPLGTLPVEISVLPGRLRLFSKT